MNQTAINFEKMVVSVRKASDVTFDATRTSKISYCHKTELFDELSLSF